MIREFHTLMRAIHRNPFKNVQLFRYYSIKSLKNLQEIYKMHKKYAIISERVLFFERRTSNPHLQMHRALNGERGIVASDVDEKPHLMSCEATCVHEEGAKIQLC